MEASHGITALKEKKVEEETPSRRDPKMRDGLGAKKTAVCCYGTQGKGCVLNPLISSSLRSSRLFLSPLPRCAAPLSLSLSCFSQTSQG